MPSIDQLTRYYASLSDIEIVEAVSGRRDDDTQEAWSVIYEEALRPGLSGSNFADGADPFSSAVDTEQTLFKAIADYLHPFVFVDRSGTVETHRAIPIWSAPSPDARRLRPRSAA